MQPASQVDILIWRSVLGSSTSSEYIKPIKPWRHTIPCKMSSNYMLYSSLSLIFTSYSVKMCYMRRCSRSHSTSCSSSRGFESIWHFVARLFGGGWDGRVSVITLLVQEGLDPAVSCALQRKRNQHPGWVSSPWLVSLVSVAPDPLAAFSNSKDAARC